MLLGFRLWGMNGTFYHNSRLPQEGTAGLPAARNQVAGKLGLFQKEIENRNLYFLNIS